MIRIGKILLNRMAKFMVNDEIELSKENFNFAEQLKQNFYCLYLIKLIELAKPLLIK
jgi:hypothetical protein